MFLADAPPFLCGDGDGDRGAASGEPGLGATGEAILGELDLPPRRSCPNMDGDDMARLDQDSNKRGRGGEREWRGRLFAERLGTPWNPAITAGTTCFAHRAAPNVGFVHKDAPVRTVVGRVPVVIPGAIENRIDYRRLRGAR